MKHEKPPPFRWGCFMAIFDYKTGDFLRFLTQTCPPTEVTAIYLHTYIYTYNTHARMQTDKCRELPTCLCFMCSSLDAPVFLAHQTKNRLIFGARSHGHSARSRGRTLIALVWRACCTANLRQIMFHIPPPCEKTTESTLSREHLLKVCLSDSRHQVYPHHKIFKTLSRNFEPTMNSSDL